MTRLIGGSCSVALFVLLVAPHAASAQTFNCGAAPTTNQVRNALNGGGNVILTNGICNFGAISVGGSGSSTVTLNGATWKGPTTNYSLIVLNGRLSLGCNGGAFNGTILLRDAATVDIRECIIDAMGVSATSGTPAIEAVTATRGTTLSVRESTIKNASASGVAGLNATVSLSSVTVQDNATVGVFLLGGSLDIGTALGGPASQVMSNGGTLTLDFPDAGGIFARGATVSIGGNAQITNNTGAGVWLKDNSSESSPFLVGTLRGS